MCACRTWRKVASCYMFCNAMQCLTAINFLFSCFTLMLWWMDGLPVCGMSVLYYLAFWHRCLNLQHLYLMISDSLQLVGTIGSFVQTILRPSIVIRQLFYLFKMHALVQVLRKVGLEMQDLLSQSFKWIAHTTHCISQTSDLQTFLILSANAKTLVEWIKDETSSLAGLI